MDVSLLRVDLDRSADGREGGTLASRGGATPETLRVRDPCTAGIYELRLDDERCRLDGVACALGWGSPDSLNVVDVDDVVDATEAVC